MLDALAIVGAQEFLDLAATAPALFVQRNADLAIGRGHRLTGQAGIFTLDVEPADLAETGDPLIKRRPVRHAAAIDIVGEVIDPLQPGTNGVALHAVFIHEINVIDGKIIAVPVDEINDRPTDAAKARQAQFHRPGAAFHRLGAALQGFGIGFRRILHPPAHAAGRSAMFGGEIPGRAVLFVIGDQVDAALPPQLHILGTVTGDLGKAHGGKHRFQYALGGRAKFDEFKAVEA